MRTYRLKKRYPSLPSTIKVGDIVKLVPSMDRYSHDLTLDTFPLNEVQDNSEFWELESKDSYFEVMSFYWGDKLYQRVGDKVNVKMFKLMNERLFDFFYDNYRKEVEMLSFNGMWVHSVKRLSDGEIFTVGDKVNVDEYNLKDKVLTNLYVHSQSILKFDLEPNSLTGCSEIEFLKKAPKNEYEILSFEGLKEDQGSIYRKDHYGEYGTPITVSMTLEECLKDKNLKIHSVKRLSDGEVFTLGDKVTYSNDKQFDFEIIKIKNDHLNRMCLFGKKEAFCTLNNTNNLPHKIKKPLFRTEDGVDIFEGDSYSFFWVNGPSNGRQKFKVYDIKKAERLNEGEYWSENAKFYSSNFKASKAVREFALFRTEDNTPIYVGDTYWCVNTAPHLWSLFEQTAKERTQLNKTVKAFITKKGALDYLLLNKPMLSLEDLRKIFKDSVSGDKKDKELLWKLIRDWTIKNKEVNIWEQ